MHKTYGKTYVPVLNIVDWVDENRLDALKGKAEPEQLPPPKPKQVMAFEPGGKQTAPTKAEVAKANGRGKAEIDDPIPF